MHKSRKQIISEEIEVIFIDKVAFEEKQREIGESEKVQNTMHIEAKRRIDHNISLIYLNCAI